MRLRVGPQEKAVPPVNPVIEALDPHYWLAAPTGSRVICDPPPADTDEDWVVWVKAGQRSNFDRAIEKFDDEAVYGGRSDREYGGIRAEFESVKLSIPGRPVLNLILTDRQDFYDRFVAATAVCKRLNLLNKPDRIAVFRAVLYAEACE